MLESAALAQFWFLYFAKQTVYKWKKARWCAKVFQLESWCGKMLKTPVKWNDRKMTKAKFVEEADGHFAILIRDLVEQLEISMKKEPLYQPSVICVNKQCPVKKETA